MPAAALLTSLRSTRWRKSHTARSFSSSSSITERRTPRTEKPRHLPSTLCTHPDSVPRLPSSVDVQATWTCATRRASWACGVTTLSTRARRRTAATTTTTRNCANSRNETKKHPTATDARSKQEKFTNKRKHRKIRTSFIQNISMADGSLTLLA